MPGGRESSLNDSSDHSLQPVGTYFPPDDSLQGIKFSLEFSSVEMGDG